MDTIKKRLSEINSTIELTDYYHEGITLEEFIEEVTTGIYQDEIIYYSRAIQYLASEDRSLTKSTELYIEQGGTLNDLNSEALATVLHQHNQLEALGNINAEIESAFNVEA